MARKPENFQWLGYTDEQVKLLDFIDFLGNNGWDRNGQTNALMTNLLGDCASKGLPISRIKDAMGAIGYDRHTLHQLDRWESKRTTGKFGR